MVFPHLVAQLRQKSQWEGGRGVWKTKDGYSFIFKSHALKIRICLTALTFVRSLIFYDFSQRLLLLLCHLATISPKTNVFPSVPIKQPSDGASVSDDTMMNSCWQPSQQTELF